MRWDIDEDCGARRAQFTVGGSTHCTGVLGGTERNVPAR